MLSTKETIMSVVLDKYYEPYRFMLNVYEAYLVTWLAVYRP